MATSEVPFPLRIAFLWLVFLRFLSSSSSIPFFERPAPRKLAGTYCSARTSPCQKAGGKAVFPVHTIPTTDFIRRTAAHCNQPAASPGLTLRTARSSPAGSGESLLQSLPPPFKRGQSAGGRAGVTGTACCRRRWRREGGRPECECDA